MRINLLRALFGVAATLLLMGSAGAQSLISDDNWQFDSDTIFTRLHTSAGTRQSNVFDLEAGQRVAITYLTDCNVGFRTTYFEWDHSANDAGGFGLISMDTYNLDLEGFKRIEMTERSVLELSGGVRMNRTKHFLNGPTNFSNFEGWGGLFGIRSGMRVCDNGLIYARGKFAVLMGDGAHDANTGPLNPANEVARSQTELGFGYEHRFDFGAFTIIPRTGFEWQMWDGFSIDPVDEHPDTDLGFSGIVAAVGITF